MCVCERERESDKCIPGIRDEFFPTRAAAAAADRLLFSGSGNIYQGGASCAQPARANFAARRAGWIFFACVFARASLFLDGCDCAAVCAACLSFAREI